MTLDEKLTNFTEYCVLAAKKKSEELILQQQAALDKDFEAYTVKSQEIADTQIKIEKENLEKISSVSKEVSEIFKKIDMIKVLYHYIQLY